MISAIKSKLKPIIKPIIAKSKFYLDLAKFKLQQDKTVDFEFDTLPKFDQGESFDQLIQKLDIPTNLPYNLKEKMEFFHANGYVVLEQILPEEQLEGIWNQIETIFKNHKQYDIEALAHRFNGQKETPIKDIPFEKLHSIGTRINDFHDNSVLVKEVCAHGNLKPFLEAVLEKNIAVFQSLIFKYSSQQAVHQDFPWVTTNIPSHLAAAWIPLEDVHVDSGPLCYYPGSHRMPKFNFGNSGYLFKSGVSLMDPEKDFTPYLEKTAQKLGFKKEVLLIKKGDVLIWHGALAHGGSPINDHTKTRKSLVVHYSSLTAYNKHRYATEAEANPEKINNVTFYTNTRQPELKNIL